MTALFLLAARTEPGGALPRNPGPATSNSGGSITNPILSEGLQGLTGEQFFQKLIPNLIGLGFVVGVIIFFFVLLIGAIQWITSGGDKNAVDSARGKITNAVIGLVILLSILALVRLIESFFNINILTLDIGPLKIE